MKKKIGIICIFLLIFIVGFLLYFSNGSIPGFKKGIVSLQDYYHSIKLDLHYLKDEYTKEVDDSGDYPKLTLKKGDKSLNVTFIENYSNAVEKDMYLIEGKEEYTDVKEVKYSKYKGYSYKFKDEYTYIMLILDCVESPRLSKDTCTSAEFTITGDFDSEMEDIVKSISFSKNYNGSLKLDGVVSINHKFAIKRFKLDDYEVDVYKQADKVIVEVLNDEKVFLGEISLGTGELTNEIYIDDIILYDSVATSDRELYKSLHTGFFNNEIDFVYKFYSNADEETTNKIVKELIKNIVVIK